MIVRDQYRVEDRQLFHGQRWRDDPFGTGKRYRRAALGEYRIGEQVPVVVLDQPGGMTDPGEPWLFRRRGQRSCVRVGERKAFAGRRTAPALPLPARSEERRVGKDVFRTYSSWGSPYDL